MIPSTAREATPPYSVVLCFALLEPTASLHDVVDIASTDDLARRDLVIAGFAPVFLLASNFHGGGELSHPARAFAQTLEVTSRRFAGRGCTALPVSVAHLQGLAAHAVDAGQNVTNRLSHGPNCALNSTQAHALGRLQ